MTTMLLSSLAAAYKYSSHSQQLKILGNKDTCDHLSLVKIIGHKKFVHVYSHVCSAINSCVHEAVIAALAILWRELTNSELTLFLSWPAAVCA